MNIKQFVPQNVYQELSVYAGRLENMANALFAETDKVATIVDALSEGNGEVSYTIEASNELSQCIHDVFYGTQTLCDASGNLIQLYAEFKEDFNKYALVLHDPGIDYDITLIDPDGINSFWMQGGGDRVCSCGTKIIEFITAKWSTAFSEAKMWRDTIGAFLSGGWNDASSFVTLLGERMRNSSEGLQNTFLEVVDVITSATSGGVSGIATALLNKITIPSLFTATSNDKLNTEVDSPAHWTVSALNWTTIAKGALTAAQFIGQLMSFVSHPLVKGIGLGLQLTCKLIDFVDTTLTTQSKCGINESGFLNSWYGDVHPALMSRTDFETLFPKVTTYPCIIDTGFIKFIANIDNSGSTEQVDVRYYDCACHNHTTALPIIQAICNRLNLSSNNVIDCQGKFVAQNIKYFVINANSVSAIDFTTLNNLYQDICTIFESGSNKTIGADEYDEYVNDDNTTAIRICYWLDTLLSIIYFANTLYANTYDGEKLYMCPIYLFDTTQAGTAFDTVDKWLDQTAKNPIYINGDYLDVNVGLTPLQAILYPVLGQYLYTGYFSVNELPSLTQIVDIRNALFDIYWRDMNVSLDNLFLHDYRQSTNMNCISLYNNITQSKVSVRCNHFAYIDWNANKDIYNDSWSLGNGCQAIVRYLPPQMTVELAIFIKVMAIGITAAICVGAAFVAYKKITNNKRQAKLYSSYNNAVENYKSNPSNVNYREMKRSSRKLRNNIKFFGESRYLSTLSGARFGWSGDSSSNAAISNLTSLAQSLPFSYNDNTDDIVLTNKILDLIK